MADVLIRHLKKKGEEHSSLELLVNQWGFDEQLIPKALQTVGSLFPHYSRHDESHSRQILVNIERLLGEGIELLTATDTWLLLEAAYWHDIGMVVPHKDLEEALTDDGFRNYVRETAEGKGELSRFAQNFRQHFSGSSMQQCFAGADSPTDAMDKFRQLMAEWFRRKHASRAGRTVVSPWEQAGISSPRTELIPKRLFRLLGQICQMHGSPFDEMMQQLPYKEAGMAQEDCHPRFVACMLRLGDLLDLDDNRFCPVMQQIAGDKRPKLSCAHEDKHASIRHFRLDRERIEVSAECATIDGYVETCKWFDWLKQEVQNQMSRWSDIAPSRELGLLPTLGDLKVDLEGHLLTLRPGEQPAFSIDGEQALRLLQGQNLYDSKFACIRELLQNAIDATLLRLWLTEDQSIFTKGNPLEAETKELLGKYPVRISLDRDPERSPKDDEHESWTLVIEDEGTGISLEDLQYMLRVGSSRNNSKRRALIDEMPEWMKPSGAFGIGFQSIFMLTDKVTMETHSLLDRGGLRIELYNPLGIHAGIIKACKTEEKAPHKCGTRLTIPLDAHKTAGNEGPYQEWQQQKYRDPLLGSTTPSHIEWINTAIAEYTKSTITPIQTPLDLPIHTWRAKHQPNREFYKFFFESKNENTTIELATMTIYSIGRQHIGSLRHEGQGVLRCSYRGQLANNQTMRYQFLFGISIDLDIISHAAGDWLSIDRSNWTPEGEERLEDLLEAGVIHAIKSIKQSSTPEDIKCGLSLYLSYNEQLTDSYNDLIEQYWPEGRDLWKQLFAIEDHPWSTISETSKKLEFTQYARPHTTGDTIHLPSEEFKLFTNDIYTKSGLKLTSDKKTIIATPINPPEPKKIDIDSSIIAINYAQTKKYITRSAIPDFDGRWHEISVDWEEIPTQCQLNLHEAISPRFVTKVVVLPHVHINQKEILTSETLNAAASWLCSVKSGIALEHATEKYQQFAKELKEIMQTTFPEQSPSTPALGEDTNQ